MRIKIDQNYNYTIGYTDDEADANNPMMRKTE